MLLFNSLWDNVPGYNSPLGIGAIVEVYQIHSFDFCYLKNIVHLIQANLCMPLNNSQFEHSVYAYKTNPETGIGFIFRIVHKANVYNTWDLTNTCLEWLNQPAGVKVEMVETSRPLIHKFGVPALDEYVGTVRPIGQVIALYEHST